MQLKFLFKKKNIVFFLESSLLKNNYCLKTSDIISLFILEKINKILRIKIWKENNIFNVK